ncbi:MAG: G5 domain-containing protein, partial [Anaerolineales bacterium]|nr:G5 domain-containing protein [Anaerolineales bacterium]
MHRFTPTFKLATVLTAFLLLTACRSPQMTGNDISVTIITDGGSQAVALPAGSTVTQALQSAGVTVGSLDKADPPLYTVLSDGDSVTLIRVEEKFETEEVVVPFERQVVRNESLPEGETRLVQAGVNGLQELT